MFVSKKRDLVILILCIVVVATYILHMTLSPHWFTLVFRLINFASLFAVGYYIFKTQGVSVIQQKIEERTQQLATLNEEKMVWLQEKEATQRESTRQEASTNLLKEKIHRWHTAFAQQQVRRLDEKEKIQHTLRRKRALQGDLADLEQARKQVMTQSLTNARRQLQEQFSSAHTQELFINDMLSYMKEEAK